MAIGILDFVGKNRLLASRAVSRPAAKIEIDPMFLAENKEAFFFVILFLLDT